MKNLKGRAKDANEPAFGAISLSVATFLAVVLVILFGAYSEGLIANTPAKEQAAMVQSMVEGLAARLEDDPSDLQGWRMLARSYKTLGQPEEALNRLKAAIESQEEGTQLRSDLERLAAEIYREHTLD